MRRRQCCDGREQATNAAGFLMKNHQADDADDQDRTGEQWRHLPEIGRHAIAADLPLPGQRLRNRVEDEKRCCQSNANQSPPDARRSPRLAA